jgi:hypothetical protein
MKIDWDADRIENPKAVPYEIDNQLKGLIERSVREEHMQIHGRHHMEEIVGNTVEYLIGAKVIVRSPYGGVFFPLPDDAVILTKEELIRETKAKLDTFFGKKRS